jgi:uncharacterized YccA/Bax inhibitor family protein
MAFPSFNNTREFQPSQRSYYSPGNGNNPFNHPVQNQQQVAAPTNVMTYEGTVRRGAIAFGILLAAAAVGWFFPILALPAALAGLVLGLVISFSRNNTSAAATLAYSALQGIVVGGISAILEARYPGVVSQAVIATFCVFAVVMFFFSKGVFRTTPLLNKIFIIAGVSYLLFGVVNVILMVTGVSQGMFGLYSDLGGWGIVIGVLGTLMASYSLVMDFEFVKNGVNNQVEARWEWRAVFGLVATLVWLYLEIIRLLSIFRQ